MTLTQITEKGIKDGEIINADINASAAIAKSKLASLDIVNGDINASAAIARSKIAEFVEDNVNDRVLTATGLSNTLQAEPKLLFTSSGGDPVLTITGSSTAGHAQLNLKTGGTTDHGSINFGDNDDDDAGEIRYTHSSNLLAFDTAGTPKMVIDSNGKVGIGTTSPAELLHLESTAGNTKLKLTQSGSTTDQTNGVIQFGNSTDAALCEIRGYTSGSTSSGYLQFLTTSSGTDVTAMTINTAGNVGIGLASPTAKFHTSAPYNVTGAKITGGASGYSNALEVYNAGGSNLLTVQGNGAVGIGTTSVGTGTVTIKGTTNAYGGVGNATVSVGAALQLEDDQGRRCSFWAPKSGEGAIGSITNHDFVIVTGNAEKARFSNNTGDFTISDGDLKVASGHGVNFSAYATSGNPSSNLLDDYEEGTYTITPLNDGGATLTSNRANYTKIGNMVRISGSFTITATNGTNNNQARFSLPFTSSINSYYVAHGNTITSTGYTGVVLSATIENSAPYMIFNPSVGMASRSWSQLGNNRFDFDIVYRV